MARILVVDDEPAIFHAIEAVLEGHEVLWAKDETEAQQSTGSTPPQLIILDYLLARTPSIPGFLLALGGKLPTVPILVLTGYGNEDVSIQSFRAGPVNRAGDGPVRPRGNMRSYKLSDGPARVSQVSISIGLTRARG